MGIMLVCIAIRIDKIRMRSWLVLLYGCQFPTLFYLRISTMRCTFSAFTYSSSAMMNVYSLASTATLITSFKLLV